MKIDERLKRLVEHPICPREDYYEYSEELKMLAEEVSDEETIDSLYRLFKALADKTRIKILKLLNIHELCVCEIMVALQLTQPTVSHHLGILEGAKLIKKRKKGKWSFYRLANEKIIDCLEGLYSSLYKE